MFNFRSGEAKSKKIGGFDYNDNQKILFGVIS